VRPNAGSIGAGSKPFSASGVSLRCWLSVYYNEHVGAPVGIVEVPLNRWVTRHFDQLEVNRLPFLRGGGLVCLASAALAPMASVRPFESE
jgi:hypothetical protein